MNKFTAWIFVVILATASLLAGSKALDHYGYKYTDQVLQRTLIAFAVARGLNGLISVAQEAEIAMSPAGVGLTVSPGEILDPVNDLIERFSVVMLVTASAIGVQKLLLSISAWDYFNWLVVIGWLSLAIYLLYQQRKQQQVNPWFIKVALFLILVRFATPMMALTSQGIYALFLEDNYQQASQGLQTVSDNIEKETEPTNNSDQDLSMMEQAQRWLNDASEQLNLKKQVENYKQAAEQASKDVIELITIFVVQTLLFPLLFLWFMFKLGSNLLKNPRRIE